MVLQTQKDNSTLKGFLSFCKINEYPAKKILIHQGQIIKHLFYIIKGNVIVLLKNKAINKEIILYYLYTGNFIGTLGIFNKKYQHSTTTIQLKTECVIASISYKKFFHVININNDIIIKIALQMADKLNYISTNFGNLVFLDVINRITIALWHLAKSPVAITHPDGMQIRITRQEIGKIVGCSRETVGRKLKILEQQNTISARGKTIIVYGAR
ncbi:cyclic nucleotide-binding domain-containing protein [Enterobacteriaceae endosymbiont of Macroplea mutica]|uniref:cyclic nucleotide-binding domain-containing protein n=1 Tax=Enterobacteriaceae endosymbiont of Macroplea mutica TaxID=2675791 RepID=UPI001449C4BA|nr:cyclic nucleotide-binding domain-containing protein [Enterobacteriaceae endosymbiont of Macroplea mutica]QJC31459.1 cyclic nucleotide-binding domain-containing protein [Enterobacteriaceae endosymbiont of Macroplea mutica]